MYNAITAVSTTENQILLLVFVDDQPYAGK